MVSTRQVNHRKGHAPAAVLRFLTGFVQTRSGYFEVSGDVQSRLQSNLSADVQSRLTLSADVQSRLYDKLVHDTATSSDVTPAGQGCALG